jgi:hypothetical protein
MLQYVSCAVNVYNSISLSELADIFMTMFVNIHSYRCCILGIDLADAAQMGAKLGEHEDVARRCKILHDTIKLYQDAMTSLEKVMCVYHVKVFNLTHISIMTYRYCIFIILLIFV